MDQLELLEEQFNKNVESIDKEFLELLKNPGEKTREVLEKEYRAKLKQAVSNYELQVSTFLSQNKKTAEAFKDPSRIMPKEEEVDENALDMSQPFVARHLDMNFTKEQIEKMKKDIEKFKKDIKFKKKMKEKIPRWVVVWSFRFSLYWRIFRFRYNSTVFRVKSQTSAELSELGKILKEFFIKSVQTLKKKIAGFVGFIKKRIFGKKEEAKEEKSEDAKIADKLLKKKKD